MTEMNDADFKDQCDANYEINTSKLIEFFAKHFPDYQHRFA